MNNIVFFKDYYSYEKNLMNQYLRKYNDSLKQSDDSIIMKKNLGYFSELNSDGKLIRGMLVNLGYSILGEMEDYSNSLALAYEIFQTAILVHDDVIDKDCKRRGKETIHFKNYQEFSKKTDEVEAVELSNSIAICMGDYGLYLANKMISDSYSNDHNLGKVLSYFNDIVLKTIKGELLDVVLPYKSRMNEIDLDLLEDSIIDIYRLKTSYYTIIGPLSLGLLLAGGSNSQINEIEKFGEKVGIAFQIQDDILGVYSDSIGKVVGSDIKEFKQTILFSHVRGTSYYDELLKYYGKEELTNDTIHQVRRILESSGSKDYALEQMNLYYNESLELLDHISWIPKKEKNILRGFVEYLRLRNK